MSAQVGIDVRDKDIRALMAEVQTGKYFLPSFQREYVWDEDDIKLLIDSVINNYPLGTIILWKPSSSSIVEIDPFSKPLIDVEKSRKHGEIFYVIDGQQRLTSLLLLFNNWEIEREGEEIEVKPISYNPVSGKLIKSVKRGINLSTLIKAFCLDDIEAFTELTQKLAKDKLKETQEKIRNILNYPVSMYIMETYEENEKTFQSMAEAFIRVNKYGIRIGNLELMLSFLAGAIGGELKQRIYDLYETLYKEFKLGLQPAIRFAFSRFGLKQTQISKVAQFRKNIERIAGHVENEVEEIFTKSDKSMKLALEFLDKNLGITSSKLLPSQTVIVPITDYIYIKGISSLSELDDVDIKNMINWFILTSFSGYYSSRTDTKLDKDLETIENSTHFPWEDLIANMQSIKAKVKITFKDLERGLHLNVFRRQGRAYLFLLYVLLIKNEADDWSGILLNQRNFDELARHHIFPQEFLKQNLNLDEPEIIEVLINNLADITFIQKDINSEIEDTPPSEYMNHYIGSAKKHFISTDIDLWTIDQYDTFLKYRIRQIHKAGKKYFKEIFE